MILDNVGMLQHVSNLGIIQYGRHGSLTCRFLSRSISACIARQQIFNDQTSQPRCPYHDDLQLALWLIPKLDLLDGHRLARAPVECLVDRTECSLPNTF